MHHPILDVDSAVTRTVFQFRRGSTRGEVIRGQLSLSPDRDEDTEASSGQLDFLSGFPYPGAEVIGFSIVQDGDLVYYEVLNRTETAGSIGAGVDWRTVRYRLRALNPDDTGDAALITQMAG